MQFRPCIDIHNGKVKQIVGGSLKDSQNYAKENYVSEKDAAYYAALYRELGLRGGHVIMLNSRESDYYEDTKKQALLALQTYNGGLMVGGGIDDTNAEEFLYAGASHVIVTSYLFENDELSIDRMKKLVSAVGAEHVVFDLSVKHFEDGYHIMSNRWQNKTNAILTTDMLKYLEKYCNEYLIHAVDVEGRANGIETDLIEELKNYKGNDITYAGGVHSYDDLKLLKKAGKGRIHVTIGSALDLFGGDLKTEKVIQICD